MFTYVTILILSFCIYFQWKSIQINGLVQGILKRYKESGTPLTTQVARQKAFGKDVEDLKKIILYKYTLASWFTRRLSFGFLYVFYVFFPLGGILLVHLGMSPANFLPASLMWFGDVSLVSDDNQARILHSYIWVPTSLVSTYGLVVCAKLSIRILREKWCSQKVRENYN